MLLAFHQRPRLDRGSKKAAIEILEKPKPSAISVDVPDDVLIASKPGELEGVRADAGIVYVPGWPGTCSW